jgi:hypothetical protein
MEVRGWMGWTMGAAEGAAAAVEEEAEVGTGRRRRVMTRKGVTAGGSGVLGRRGRTGGIATATGIETGTGIGMPGRGRTEVVGEFHNALPIYFVSAGSMVEVAAGNEGLHRQNRNLLRPDRQNGDDDLTRMIFPSSAYALSDCRLMNAVLVPLSDAPVPQ